MAVVFSTMQGNQGEVQYGKLEIITALTPNSMAITTNLGSMNQETYVQIYGTNIPYWTTLVSASNTRQRIPKKAGNAIITFKNKLSIEFYSQGERFQIFLNGKIKDSGSIYKLKGKLIGDFSIG